MPFKMIKIKNKLIAAKSKSCSKIPNSFIILVCYFTKLIMDANIKYLMSA